MRIVIEVQGFEYESSEQMLDRIVTLTNFQKEDWAFYGPDLAYLRRDLAACYKERRIECAELLFQLRLRNSGLARAAKALIDSVWWE